MHGRKSLNKFFVNPINLHTVIWVPQGLGNSQAVHRILISLKASFAAQWLLQFFSIELKKKPPSKKFHLLRKLVKNAKWWSKSNLPLSPSQTAQFKKGFKNPSSPRVFKLESWNFLYMFLEWFNTIWLKNLF